MPSLSGQDRHSRCDGEIIEAEAQSGSLFCGVPRAVSLPNRDVAISDGDR
jgi:hypothetical protein